MNSLKSLPSHVCLFLLLCWFLGNGGLQLSCAQITDTIKPGGVLGYLQTLVSADGRFQLGFFNTSGPDGGYLGIWYVNDEYKSKVWVGNRDKPVLVGNGNLTMDVGGQLKIVHDGRSPIPLNADKATPNSIATLENSGNLRVKELNSDGSTKSILWQSFDHPTDTLLPGMKLGMNFKTQQKWMLTSWVTDQIPAVGGFSLEWNSTAKEARQLIMRFRGDMYWVGNTSNFEEAASFSFEGQYYTFSYVFSENESYFSYSVPDGQISRWVLNSDGSFVDNPKPIVVRSGMCFGYSSDAGCVKSKAISCRNHNQKFEKRRGSFFPSSPDLDDNSSISIGDCWARCWNTCSCVGFSTFPNNGTGCRFYHGKFVQDNVGDLEQLYVQIETVGGGINIAKKWGIGVAAAIIAALVVLLGLICFLRRRKLHRNEENKEEAELLAMIASGGDQDANEISIDGKKDHDLKVFSFPDIEAATNNFSIENKLGQGGFGPVYKGKLPGGQEIAVKRLSMSSGQGLVEFKNELLLIAKLQHMNLVRLLGCSVKGNEKILIYEYMPNKSLDFFLFDSKRKELLNWELRYNIIEGIAQGLLYLHKYSRVRIIHRDLKASNILLDKDMNPKISDFGMARVFGRNDTEANTIRVVGTYGYMSPEYAMNGNFSEKSDVYSFGVLLLEILSGQKNNGFYDPERPMSLVGYAWELWKEGRSSEIMDLTLVQSNSAVQILRCIHVGLLCVQEFATDRPTMSTVISMLKNEMLQLPTPKQVAFSTERKVMETNLPNREQEISIASGTISEINPR